MRTFIALLLLSGIALGQEKEGPIRRENTNKPITAIKDVFKSFPKECIPDDDQMTGIQTKLADQWGEDQIAVPLELSTPMKIRSISTGDGDVFIELVADFKKGEAPFKQLKQYNITCRISEKDTAALRQAASLKVGKTCHVSGKVERILTQANYCQIILMTGPKILAD